MFGTYWLLVQEIFNNLDVPTSRTYFQNLT